MASVTLENITKRFGDAEVLTPTNVSIADGELVVIVGPSGCGKSTLLRIIAGLEEPTAGRLLIGDRDVTQAAPADRGVAMVFQSYALYPHLSVRDNLGFALSIKRVAKAEIARKVADVAAMLGLTDLLDRRPRQLSGGQRQRVAIGRAVIREPGVLLLDEPLSNLDAALRVRMRHEFAKLHQELKATMVYVTHDQLEAMTLADRIVVMSNGRVEQVGAPMELYAAPASRAVAAAIGSPAMNMMPVEIVAPGQGTAIRLPDGNVTKVAVATPASAQGETATLGIRPEHLRSDHDGVFTGRAELFERLGPLSFVHLGERGKEATLVAQMPGDWRVTIGETLRFGVDPAGTHLFAANGQAYPRA